jgi:Tol biopolymer transport system component
MKLGVLVLAMIAVLGATGSAATLRIEPPRLTFTVEGRGICLDRGPTRRAVRLTPARRNIQPSWSPTGRRLAFVNLNDGYLYVQDAHGRGRPIAGDPFHENQGPAWSPDGRRIAFSAGRHGARLMMIRPDGMGNRALTNGPFDTNPAWSPDGTRIAFARQGVAAATSVLILEVAGGAERLLVEDASGPSWSPDGRFVVFSRRLGDRQRNLFVIGADGAGERRLTTYEGYDMQPAWSPDGAWVAFTRLAPGSTNADIVAVRPNGTGLRVVRGSRSYESDPTWRPSAPPRSGKGPCSRR